MRFRRRLSALTLVVLAARASSADERPPGDDPVLAALVEEALAKNPDVLGAQETVRALETRPDQERALADPMLSVTYTNDGWAPTLGERDMTTLGFMASQELPWPGKRRVRGEIGAREADLAARQEERARLTLVAEVRRAYYGLLLAREQLALVREQAEIWRETEGVARARYGVGQGAQQDVLRVQVEITRVGQLEAEQEAEGAVRLAELNRLLARPGDAPLETSARLTVRPETRTVAELVDWTAAISPEVRASETSLERGRLAVDLARLDFKPDFTVQAGYMNRGGLDPMWQAGIGINLPLQRRRRDAAVGEAEARLRAGERRQEAVRLQLRYRTQERLLQLQAAERLALLYRDGIIPQGQMSVEAAIASYQAGKVPFVAVLEALATLYDDRARHLRILAGHERIRARLEEASLDAASDMPEAGGPSMSPMPGRAVSAMGAGAALGGAAPAGGMSMGSMGGR
jgi:outer membrane protein TolC